jgi:hypothetical protein
MYNIKTMISPELFLQPDSIVRESTDRHDLAYLHARMQAQTNAVIAVPESLGGGEIAVEALDRTYAQDRLTRYLLLGPDAKTEQEGEGYDIHQGVLRPIEDRSQIRFFEYAAVMRGLSKLVDDLASKPVISDAQAQFIARYEEVDGRLQAKHDTRHRSVDISEKLDRLRKREIEAREQIRAAKYSDEEAREHDQKVIRIQTERSEAAIERRRQELFNGHNLDPARSILSSLLNGELPQIGTQKDAINLLDALMMRADYIFPGKDLDSDLVHDARRIACLVLSYSASLTARNPLGYGGYRIAAEARMIRAITQARHTTGNPPPNQASKFRLNNKF